jgi:hypothetical protein
MAWWLGFVIELNMRPNHGLRHFFGKIAYVGVIYSRA